MEIHAQHFGDGFPNPCLSPGSDRVPGLHPASHAFSHTGGPRACLMVQEASSSSYSSSGSAFLSLHGGEGGLVVEIWRSRCEVLGSFPRINKRKTLPPEGNNENKKDFPTPSGTLGSSALFIFPISHPIWVWPAWEWWLTHRPSVPPATVLALETYSGRQFLNPA